MINKSVRGTANTTEQRNMAAMNLCISSPDTGIPPKTKVMSDQADRNGDENINDRMLFQKDSRDRDQQGCYAKGQLPSGSIDQAEYRPVYEQLLMPEFRRVDFRQTEDPVIEAWGV